jgi:glucan phosphoethanolaminetransferase (alkaline phosphatase superfamily)
MNEPFLLPLERAKYSMAKHNQAIKDRAFLVAIVFSLFLLFYEEWRWAAITYYFFNLSTFAPLPLRLLGITQILLSLFLVILFSWASFTAAPRWRFLYFLLFAATLIAQYSYGYTLNRFMSIRDLYTAFASPVRLWLASGSFFAPASLPPIVLYGGLLWWARSEKETGRGVLTAVILTLLLAESLVFYSDQHYLNIRLGIRFYEESPALSLPAMFRTLAGTMLAEAQTARLDREQLTYTAPNLPQNNIVYIIDESLRGDHLSINGYPRPTTPYLDELQAQGLARSWGIASASATDSRKSNSVLISGISQLPDPAYQHEQYPTIFQYAKAMGYTTYYFDAQTAHLWNTMSINDLNFVDHWINTDQLTPGREIDFQVADQVQAITSQSSGNFILINKEGVHFHYNDRYPAEQAVWTPVTPTGIYQDSALVINSYDNAIRYNVDGFWRRLIPDPHAMEVTLYLYTGDHGDTLVENDESWMHGGNSQQEARVPIILVGQQPFTVDLTYRASHFNLFPTLLDLMGYPVAERPHGYAHSLLSATAADSTNRYFQGGNAEPILFEAP